MDRVTLVQAWRKVRAEATVRDIYQEAKRFARKTAIWMLISEAIILAEVYPVKFIWNDLQSGNRTSAFHMALVMLTLYVLGTAVWRNMDINRHHGFWLIRAILWGYGHRVQQRLSTDYHVSHSTGDKESVMEKNVDKVQNLVDDFLFEAIPTALRVIYTTIGVGLLVGWSYGVLCVITVITYVTVAGYGQHRTVADRVSARAEDRIIDRFGTETTVLWRVLKLFGFEEQRCDQNQAMLVTYAVNERPRSRRFLTLLAAQSVVITCSRVALYSMIILSFRPGEQLGTVILATAWVERVYFNFYGLANFQRRLNETLEPLRELAELFLMTPSVRQSDAPVSQVAQPRRIELKDVSLVYPDQTTPALDGVSLTIAPYQTVALIGFSGSGKSSLASLLAREYDPTAGTILIDGVDLRDVDYYQYRGHDVAVVSQDVQLFDGTVTDNIRLGKLDATIDEVIAAAKQAGADEFIVKLAHGYDSMVGEDGIRLSGGQKQRLAIARALIRQPSILILDEATSALDAVSQQKVQQAIDRLIAERACTIIVIAHRHSTIQTADLIVVLDNGKISEIGTHEQLARRNGLYRILRDLEAKGILDEDADD